MSTDRIIAFVMAGGQGSRLQPLTTARSKPSVPFGARYRIADFVLSNLVNFQIRTIYLLVQYKSQSLIEHVRKGWTISPLMHEQFVTVVPPQMRTGETRSRTSSPMSSPSIGATWALSMPTSRPTRTSWVPMPARRGDSDPRRRAHQRFHHPPGGLDRGEDVELDECIVMDYVRIGKGARLRRVIVDRHNRIEAGERLGFDAAADRKRFTVSESGITVIPTGKVSYFARDSREGTGSGYAE